MTSVTSNDSEMGARWSTMPLAKQGSVAKATSYVLQKVTSLRSSRPQRDDDWELAGCYQAGPVPLEVYPTVDMSSSPHSFLAPGQKFHLLELVRGPVISVAHVLPLAKNSRPGWILLEQPEGHGPPPVPKRRIAASSWSINGRYAVKYPATMRQEVALTSTVAGYLEKGDEVLMLELGVSESLGEPARLRMKVAASCGIVGWITAIPPGEAALIDSTNLLAPEVVEVRRSHRTTAARSGRACVVPCGKNRFDGSFESAAMRGARWIEGADYRVLQGASLRETSSRASPVVGKVRPGMVVRVLRLTEAKEDTREMACVTLLPNLDLTGYVYCQDEKGFDVIDTRDLGEVAKVQAWLARQAKNPDADASKTAPIQDGDAVEEAVSEEEAGPEPSEAHAPRSEAPASEAPLPPPRAPRCGAWATKVCAPRTRAGAVEEGHATEEACRETAEPSEAESRSERAASEALPPPLAPRCGALPARVCAPRARAAAGAAVAGAAVAGAVVADEDTQEPPQRKLGCGVWPPAAICTPRAKAPEVAAEDDAEDSEDAVTEPDEDGADAEGVAKADADDASKSDASEVAKTDVDVAKSEGSSKADADDAAKSEDASKADADDAAKTEADEDSEEDDSSEEASEAAPKALAPWQRLGCIVGPTKALCVSRATTADANDLSSTTSSQSLSTEGAAPRRGLACGAGAAAAICAARATGAGEDAEAEARRRRLAERARAICASRAVAVALAEGANLADTEKATGGCGQTSKSQTRAKREYDDMIDLQIACGGWSRTTTVRNCFSGIAE